MHTKHVLSFTQVVSRTSSARRQLTFAYIMSYEYHVTQIKVPKTKVQKKKKKYMYMFRVSKFQKKKILASGIDFISLVTF